MIEIEDYLHDVEYPCGRDELLRRAAANGAGDNVVGHLGALPERDYDCLDTVHDTLDESRKNQ
jgi:hypothetical protein